MQKMASNSLKNPGILWLRKSGNPEFVTVTSCHASLDFICYRIFIHVLFDSNALFAVLKGVNYLTGW